MRHSDIFKELYMSHNVTILAIWNSVDPQRAMEWGAVKAGALRFAPGISLVRWAETGAGRGGKRLEKVWAQQDLNLRPKDYESSALTN